MTPFADIACRQSGRIDSKLLEPQQGHWSRNLGVNWRLYLSRPLVYLLVWQGKPPSSILPALLSSAAELHMSNLLTSCPSSFTHIRRPSKGISLNKLGLRNSLSTS